MGYSVGSRGRVKRSKVGHLQVRGHGKSNIWVCKMSDERCGSDGHTTKKGPCILKLQAVARAAPNGTCPLNLPPIISLSSSTLSDVLRPTCLNRCDRCRSVSSEDFRRPSPGFCVFSSAMPVSSGHTGRCQRVRGHGRAAPKTVPVVPCRACGAKAKKHRARNSGMPADLMHLAECPSKV